MKKYFLTVLVVAMVAMSVVSAWAETYYVRTDGNNSNTGIGNSPDQAWATVQYAADNATPGDVILIQSGVYLETVTIKNAGLSDLPITYRGEGAVVLGGMDFPGVSAFSSGINYFTVLENLRFDGALGISDHGIYIYGSSYVTVDGCIIENYNLSPWGSPGITFGNNGWRGCSAITVKNSILRNNYFGATAPGSGMLSNSRFENTTFSGNHIGYFAGNWGTSYVTFSNCTFTGNQYGSILEGVYWYWLKTHDNTFNRCVFTNNGTGLLIGDETASAYNGNSYANKVINSDFYGNSGAGILVKTNFARSGSPAYYDSLGQTFVNNIFLNNGTFGIDNLVNQTIYASYNVAYLNGSGPGNNAIFDAGNHSLTIDPQLVNPSTGDFRLKTGSPCIDAGSPAYDADPARTGDHIDIGAIEYTATPSQILDALASDASQIPESYLKNKNNSLPLSKKLYVAMQMVIRGDEATDPVEKSNFYHSALQKLTNDILPKTDGCVAGGAPDNNDWITVCETQAEFYGPIMDLISMLQSK